MMKRSVVALLMLLAISATGTAFAAEIIDATKPEQILAIARGFGSATLEKDKSGDPKIVCKIEDIKFGIYFYGCSGGKNCNAIQFAAGWSGQEITLAAINKWNTEKRLSRAFLDSDNDPILKMDINLDYGVTRQNLEDSFEIWEKTLGAFEEALSE